MCVLRCGGVGGGEGVKEKGQGKDYGISERTFGHIDFYRPLPLSLSHSVLSLYLPSFLPLLISPLPPRPLLCFLIHPNLLESLPLVPLLHPSPYLLASSLIPICLKIFPMPLITSGPSSSAFFFRSVST